MLLALNQLYHDVTRNLSFRPPFVLFALFCSLWGLLMSGFMLLGQVELTSRIKKAECSSMKMHKYLLYCGAYRYAYYTLSFLHETWLLVAVPTQHMSLLLKRGGSVHYSTVNRGTKCQSSCLMCAWYPNITEVSLPPPLCMCERVLFLYKFLSVDY